MTGFSAYKVYSKVTVNPPGIHGPNILTQIRPASSGTNTRYIEVTLELRVSQDYYGPVTTQTSGRWWSRSFDLSMPIDQNATRFKATAWSQSTWLQWTKDVDGVYVGIRDPYQELLTPPGYGEFNIGLSGLPMKVTLPSELGTRIITVLHNGNPIDSYTRVGQQNLIDTITIYGDPYTVHEIKFLYKHGHVSPIYTIILF